jgi:hypothetical protein
MTIAANVSTPDLLDFDLTAAGFLRSFVRDNLIQQPICAHSYVYMAFTKEGIDYL